MRTMIQKQQTVLNFQPNFYDLLLVDINMPLMNGFQFSERILEIDINVKICFMSAGEIHREALREIHPSISLGCFIKKPVTIDYLIDRIMQEVDQHYDTEPIAVHKRRNR